MRLSGDSRGGWFVRISICVVLAAALPAFGDVIQKPRLLAD